VLAPRKSDDASIISASLVLTARRALERSAAISAVTAIVRIVESRMVASSAGASLRRGGSWRRRRLPPARTAIRKLSCSPFANCSMVCGTAHSGPSHRRCSPRPASSSTRPITIPGTEIASRPAIRSPSTSGIRTTRNAWGVPGRPYRSEYQADSRKGQKQIDRRHRRRSDMFLKVLKPDQISGRASGTNCRGEAPLGLPIFAGMRINRPDNTNINSMTGSPFQ
jgi:hypothetical protein